MDDAVDAAVASVDVVDQRAERVGVANVAGQVLDAGAAPAQAGEGLADLAGVDEPAITLLDQGRRHRRAGLAVPLDQRPPQVLGLDQSRGVGGLRLGRRGGAADQEQRRPIGVGQLSAGLGGDPAGPAGDEDDRVAVERERRAARLRLQRRRDEFEAGPPPGRYPTSTRPSTASSSSSNQPATCSGAAGDVSTALTRTAGHSWASDLSRPVRLPWPGKTSRS